MCEQTPIHYKHGDIVWVKLDLSWWPGQVIDFEALPSDLQESFTLTNRKKPLVVVSFFQEENYEFVMNLNTIYSYNCTRKDDFIRRAMDLIRAKNTLMDKFPSDIQIAEQMTGGNMDILKDPKYGPQKKKTNYASIIFGKKKDSPSRPKGRPRNSDRSFKGNVIHPRFTGVCDDYEVRLLVQTSIPESPIKQSKYSCERCAFESSRIDVIVLHNKSHAYDTHSPRNTSRPSISPRRPLKKFKIPASRTNTIEEDLALLEQGISLTDNESSSYEEEEIEIIKPKVKRKQKVSEKRKGKRAKIAQPVEEDKKKDIRGSLLAEWEDEEEDDDVSINNNLSMESATTSFAETPTKPRASTPEKLTTTKDKSCFDFKEEEENHILTATTSSGRKIPRVIPEKRKSIEPGASNPEDTFEADLNRFAEVLESTTAPELPSSLKCEQNFHNPKAIKFPDKCTEPLPKAESTPKLINIKKRFVKSFNEFEHSLKIEKDKKENKQPDEETPMIDNCEAGNEVGLTGEVKPTEISISSINDEDIPLTSLKNTVEDSIGMEIDFHLDSMDHSLRLDDDVAIGNHSTSSEVTDNLLAIDIPDNLEEANKSVLNEETDNLEQKTIAEITISGVEIDSEVRGTLKTDSETMGVTECTYVTKTNSEVMQINLPIAASKNDVQTTSKLETTLARKDVEPLTATETTVADKTNIVSTKTNTENIIITKLDTIPQDVSDATSKTDIQAVVSKEPDAETPIDTIIDVAKDIFPQAASVVSLETRADVGSKREDMTATNTELIEITALADQTAKHDLDIKRSSKETKIKKSSRDEEPKSIETKMRRKHAEDHLPIKKSRYSRKPFYEESKKTRPKRLSEDTDQKSTRTKRPSFSLEDDDSIKKLMSKLPSFSADQSGTSSYSADFEEELKTTRWDQRPFEATKKMRPSQSSFSDNFDEYIKKSKMVRSPLDVDEDSKKNTDKSSDYDDQKKSRSTHLSFSRDIEEDIKKKSSSGGINEDLKKTRSKRFSGTHDDEDVKKTGSSRASFASIFEEDLKKRRSTRSSFKDLDEDTKKKTKLSSTVDIVEDVKKKSTFEINDDLKKKSTRFSVPTDFEEELNKKASSSVDINQDVKKTRSTRSSITHDIDKEVKKSEPTGSSFASVFEEDLKKKISTRSSLSHDTDENVKKKLPSTVDTDDLKKTRSTRSSLSSCYVEDNSKKRTVDEDIKKPRSTRSSFSPDFEEGTKKIKSTRSSVHYDICQDSKKKLSKHSDNEDSKKSGTVHIDEYSKKRTPKQSSGDFDEHVKKASTAQSSSSPDLDVDLKQYSSISDSTCEELKESSIKPYSLSEGVDEDLNKTKIQISHITDIDEKVKKSTTTQSPQSVNVDEDFKKSRSTRSSFSRDIDDGLKKKSLKQLTSAASVDDELKKTKYTGSSSHEADEISKKKTSKLPTYSPEDIVEDLTESASEVSAQSTNIDEDAKKIKSARSAFDIDKDLKKNKSTRSFSQSVDEDSKKIRSTRSSLSQDVDRDVKKKLPTPLDEGGKKTTKPLSAASTDLKKAKTKLPSMPIEFEEDSKTCTSKRFSPLIDSKDVPPFSSEVKSTALLNIDLEDTNKIKQPLGIKKAKSKWMSVLNDDDDKKEVITKSESVEVDKRRKLRGVIDDGLKSSSSDSVTTIEDTKKPKSRWSSFSSDTEQCTKKNSKALVDDDSKETPLIPSSISVDIVDDVKKIKSKWSALSTDEESAKSTTGDEIKTLSTSVDTNKTKSAAIVDERVTKNTLQLTFDEEDKRKKVELISDDIKKLKSKWSSTSSNRKSTRKPVLDDDNTDLPVSTAVIDETKKIKSKWSLIPENDEQSTSKKRWSDEESTKKASKQMTEDNENFEISPKHSTDIVGNKKSKSSKSFSVSKEVGAKKKSKMTLVSTDTTKGMTSADNFNPDISALEKSKELSIPEDDLGKELKCSNVDSTKLPTAIFQKETEISKIVEDTKTEHSKWLSVSEDNDNEKRAKKKSKRSLGLVNEDSKTTKSTLVNDEKKETQSIISPKPYAEDKKKAKSRWSLISGDCEERPKNKSKLPCAESLINEPANDEVEVSKEAIVEDIKRTKSKWAPISKNTEVMTPDTGLVDNKRELETIVPHDSTTVTHETKKMKTRWSSIPGDTEEKVKKKSKQSLVSTEEDSSQITKSTIVDNKKDVQATIPSVSTVAKDINEAKLTRSSVLGDFEDVSKKKSKWSSLSVDDYKKDIEIIIPSLLSTPDDHNVDMKKKLKRSSISPSTSSNISKLIPANDERNIEIEAINPLALPFAAKDTQDIKSINYEGNAMKKSKLHSENDNKNDNQTVSSASIITPKDTTQRESKCSIFGNIEEDMKMKLMWSLTSAEEDSTKISTLSAEVDNKNDIQSINLAATPILSVNITGDHDEDDTEKKSKGSMAKQDTSKINVSDENREIPTVTSTEFLVSKDTQESKLKWSSFSENYEKSTKKSKRSLVAAEEDSAKKILKSTAAGEDIKEIEAIIPSVSPVGANYTKETESELSPSQDCLDKISKPIATDKKEIPAIIPLVTSEDSKKPKTKWTTTAADYEDGTEKKSKGSSGLTDEDKSKQILKLTSYEHDKKEIQVTIPSVASIASQETESSAPGDHGDITKKLGLVLTDEVSSKRLLKLSAYDDDSKKIHSISNVPVEYMKKGKSKSIEEQKELVKKESSVFVDEDILKSMPKCTNAAEETKLCSKWSPVSGEFDESEKKKSRWTYGREESKKKSRWSVATEESIKASKSSSISSDNSEELDKKSKPLSISVHTEESKQTANSPSVSSGKSESLTKSKLSPNFSEDAEDLKKTSKWTPVLTDPTEESKKVSLWTSVSNDAIEESINKSKWSPVSSGSIEDTKMKLSGASSSAKDSRIRFKWSISPDLQGGIKKRSKWSTDFQKKKVMSQFPSRSFDFEDSAKKTKSKWSLDSPDYEDTKGKSKWSVEEETKESKPTAVDIKKSLPEGEDDRRGLCLKVSKLKSRLMDKLHESEIELQRPKPKTWIQQKAEERLLKRRLSSRSPRRLSLQSQEISIGKAVDKVEVTINLEDTRDESSRVSIEEKQVENVPELIDDKIESVEVKIPIEESKLESILRSPGLPQEDDENSALNTLATISEMSSYDLCKTDINIEKNLTVVSESDLGDTQVEIAKIPIIEEGTVKATTVASFTVDFTEDLSVLENKKKLTESKTCPMSQDILEVKQQSSEGVKMFDREDDADMLEDKKKTEDVNVLIPRRKEKFRILEDVAIFEKKEKSATDDKPKSPINEDDKILKKKDVAELEKKALLISNKGVAELEENKLSVNLEGATVLEERDMSVVVLEEVITSPNLDVTASKDTDKPSLLVGCENQKISTIAVDTSSTLEDIDLFENKKTSSTPEDVAVNEKLSPTLDTVDYSKIKRTPSIIEDLNKVHFSEENKPSKIQEEFITKKIDILSDVKIPEVSPSPTFRSKKGILPPNKFAERQFPPKKFIEQIPNSLEMEMAKLTDTSMDTAIVEQPQESTTSTKLLEILTDPKVPKLSSSHTSQLKIANPKFELEASPPTKPKTKLLIRSSLPSSSRTGGKQMIISEKIIKTTKEIHSSPVSVQKTNDPEGIEAFIIHKKDTNNEGLKVMKKPATKKPTILDHTIIKPKDEGTSPAAQKSDENVFDIDSMPIVLTDQILTPENIDKVPIMIPQEKSTAKLLSGKMKLLNRTPLVKETSSTRSQHFGKGLKPQKIFQHHSIARQGGIMNQTKSKVMIVPSEASTSTGSNYTMGKRLVKKIPTTTTIVPGSSKLHNVPEPTGNKIMIVTNNQGQQSRVVLTPAQQKLIGYQSPTMKKVVKGTKSANIISQTIINSKGQITTTNQAGVTSTTSSLSQAKRPKIEPSRNKVLGQKLLLQSSLNQLKPGQPRTIIIKNPQGQTVKKIHGTDDALLEKQVQEQIEAINRATWSQGTVKHVPKKYSKKTLTESTKIAIQQKAQMINSSGASGTKATSIPPLSPIIKKTETQVKPKPVSPKAPPSPSPAQSESEKVGEKRAPHQLVIQDALGNQTTITEGQILALPSETVDGQPQSYMLVTLDETGNLTPLNNEALMSLDPNLNLGGDLSNMVLQIDQGAMNTEPSVETSPPPVTQESKAEEVTVEETEIVPVIGSDKLVTETSQSVDSSEMQTVACAINNGESNQQLIITGDPASTQKFLESLSEGNADLANLLANTEGNILIHADGQQILINTDADNPLLLSMNSDGTPPSLESGEGSGNPIFSSQAPKNQDILAAALADTDVFQQEQSIISAKVTQSQLSPTGGALYPINVNNVLETSAMSSPIMTPLEVPSTNSKKIDVETDILAQVPKNVDLPITITDPNISQTVAHQQAALMSSDLHTNLDLPLAIQDVTVTSAEMNSPTFTYAHLDDSVDMQKPFTNSISMPLLTEIPDDVATTSSITASTTLPTEIIEVEHDKEIHVETSIIPEKIHEETVIEESITIPEDVKKTDSQYLLATSGLSSISNQMCSSLSEPPPDMFDFTIDQTYDLKQQSMEISPPVTESPVDDEFLDAEKTESESEQASFTPQSNSPSTNSTDSCEIPMQPEIVTDFSSKSSETELRPFDEDEKM